MVLLFHSTAIQNQVHHYWLQTWMLLTTDSGQRVLYSLHKLMNISSYVHHSAS